MYEISYYLEPADIRRIARAAYREAGLFWKIPVILCLLICLTIGMVVVKERTLRLDWLVFLPLAICWPIYFWNVSRIGAREIKQSREWGHFNLTTVTIEREGLHQSRLESQFYFKWSGVKSVIADENFIQFAMTDGSGFIVPLRAFHDKQSADEFLAAAQQFHQAAN